MAKLIFSGPNFSGRIYQLVLEKTTVGRGDQNTLVIRDNSVSLAHCEILMYGPEIIVRDLDSSNGTFVEGIRLNKQSQAKSGQTIRFGTVEARLELDRNEEESDGSELTAVYTLDKIQREQSQAKSQSQAGAASMQLKPALDSPPGENTTVLLKPNPPRAAPILSFPEQPNQSVGKSSAKKVISIAVLVLLALVGLFWLLWTRR